MLKNVVLLTNNVDSLVEFYGDVFGLMTVARREGNVVLTGGIVIQDAGLIDDGDACSSANVMLYFEERDLEYICMKVEGYGVEVTSGREVNPAGREYVRFKDLAGHLIEVAKEG